MVLIYVALALATLIAVFGSAVGVGLGHMARGRLELLVHVATGALLGITAFDILPEAKAVLPWGPFIVAVLGGYALLWGVGHFVFYVCPSCAIAHMDEDKSLARKGSLVLLATALGIHCLLDGVAITTGGMLSQRAETGALIAVGLHKLPEGLALGLLLVGARYTKGAALSIAAGIEALTIVGGIAGLIFAGAPTPEVVGVVFAVVGGGFVYLVWNAFGGAFTHQAHLARSRGITVEALAFLVTGGLFWVATRL